MRSVGQAVAAEPFSRSELAALAVVTGRRQLLFCDGGLGALDLGADLDAGVASLRSRGLLESGVDEPRGLALEGLRILDDHDAEMTVTRADGVRRSTVAFLSAQAALVIANGTGPAGSTFDFVVTSRLRALWRLRDALALNLLTGRSLEGDPESIRLCRDDLDVVKALGRRKDALGIRDALVPILGDANLADRFAHLLCGRPVAIELSVARRGSSGPVLERLCWNALPGGGVWEYVVDMMKGELLLTSSDPSRIRAEVDAMLEALA